MPAKPILLVTASTFPRWDGDSEPRFVHDLCTRLAGTFEVLVLAPHAIGANTFEESSGIKIFRYRYAPKKLETLAYNGGITANLKQSPWKYLLLPGFFLGQWLAMRKILNQYPVDAVHAHWLIPQGLIAVTATMFMNTKNKPSLLCTSHGGDLFGLRDPISTYLKRWVIRRSDAISVVSTAMVQNIEALAGKTNVNVIPMGTDLTSTFIPSTSIHRIPKQLLFAGRLVEKKGLTHLLHALKIVVSLQPEVTLVIAGSGPLQQELETTAGSLGISEHVAFKGRLSHTELVKCYQQSSLAVFPFVQAKDGDMEGLGLVMVEAMGCGCPVIASDLPAVKDVIRSNKMGHLVPPGNVEVLAKTILNCLEAPLTNKAQPSETLRKIKQQFDWDFVSKAYSCALAQIISPIQGDPLATQQPE